MGHFLLHWGIVGILLFGIPFSQIIVKAGFSRWWILVMFVPLVNVILLWIFAFTEWPRDKKKDILLANE